MLGTNCQKMVFQLTGMENSLSVLGGIMDGLNKLSSKLDPVLSNSLLDQQMELLTV